MSHGLLQTCKPKEKIQLCKWTLGKNPIYDVLIKVLIDPLLYNNEMSPGSYNYKDSSHEPVFAISICQWVVMWGRSGILTICIKDILRSIVCQNLFDHRQFLPHARLQVKKMLNNIYQTFLTRGKLMQKRANLCRLQQQGMVLKNLKAVAD